MITSINEFKIQLLNDGKDNEKIFTIDDIKKDVRQFSMVMWHGSGNNNSKRMDLGAGIYWADNKNYASAFGSKLYIGNIELDNILFANAKKLSALSKKITGDSFWPGNDKLFRALKNVGIQGIRRTSGDFEDELVDWTLDTKKYFIE